MDAALLRVRGAAELPDRVAVRCRHTQKLRIPERGPERLHWFVQFHAAVIDDVMRLRLVRLCDWSPEARAGHLNDFRFWIVGQVEAAFIEAEAVADAEAA